MNELSAAEAAEVLSNTPDNYLLLDVREPVELQIAAINNAVHIPMGEIPSRLDELDRDKTIICLCKSGGRSAQVGHFLLDQGFSKVINLAGGINAWSEDVDSTIPFY